MRLFEHPDFEQAVIRAAAHFRPLGLREAIIEKDYYNRVSTAHFPESYVPPPAMSFAQSDALFPAAELREMISSNFEAQCRVLCFGPFPSWDEVEARLEHIRHLL
jgi:hypothetical protein